MATLSDVATRAGVSVSAVSRVLSEKPGVRVSVATRQRIHDAAKELNYRPNFTARALKSSRTHAVGLVVPGVTNAIFAELMRGVEEEARTKDYMVLIASTERLPEGEESIPRLMGEGRVDGVLVQFGDHLSGDDLRTVTDSGLPVISINTINPGSGGSVRLEDEAGMRLATEHLIELGHTRIGYAGGVPTSESGQRRLAGFLEAMAAAKLTVEPELVADFGYYPKQGAQALDAMAELSTPPTAVVVANINAAHGVLSEARRLGIRVPEDMSIVAMHDTWTAEIAWPPLTCVRLPLYELGRAAMASLWDNINSGTAEDRVIADPAPELIVRESTAPPAR
ncbi:LacI family DNA-binding transcriptional regulator [Salinibacterium sp. NSLL150]|uniref:LacI family DNA-binding transcriptional regulator n=1 Tax=unclassified Salinibacterium TaxID=2632331 RepID=UPI0018CDC9E8|nr:MULTISPECIES: LacI family DNA-binding transcriptional regulator [unclassified Salinibacterium]MBH0097822.1 LacI family DNA-binding transcriptional regulator [Salinibacterium sp. NSLL35]MBH0100577.1 LacI family DNA-binding transcriptional regulator [Salinibacterium sp. NSLL150]MBH0103336.1 LacI family DNA-binding transcriptional regulator [Salinibacterium sp. NSLL16]MBH0106097.1 LacI family DNA-binding transcriptional regulator [Salinibacterium sp. NSLL17]